MVDLVTISVASAYRSQHRAKHCCSLLVKLLLGLVTHALKHLSRTVCALLFTALSEAACVMCKVQKDSTHLVKFLQKCNCHFLLNLRIRVSISY